MTDKTTNPCRVQTPEFRLSYPHLTEPQRYGDEKEASFKITLIVPKSDTEGVKKLKSAVTSAIEKKWGSDRKNWPRGMKNPIRDGDTEGLDGEGSPREGYEGSYFLQAKRKESFCKKAHVVVLAPGANGKPIYLRNVSGETPLGTNAIDDIVYAGCWCEAVVEAFPYEIKSATGVIRGVSFGLVAVRKVRDDEPFSKVDKVKVEDYWGEVSSLTDADKAALSGAGSDSVEDDDLPF
jgi:hypothetical protein